MHDKDHYHTVGETITHTVELLYFDGCPNYKTALKELQEVIAEMGVSAKISMVRVKSEKDAGRLKFLGSPSIRVNGLDVDPLTEKSEHYSLRCRIYYANNRAWGYPTKEILRKALSNV